MRTASIMISGTGSRSLPPRGWWRSSIATSAPIQVRVELVIGASNRARQSGRRRPHCSDAKDRRLLIRPLLVQLDILIEHDTVSAERRADALCTLS